MRFVSEIAGKDSIAATLLFVQNNTGCEIVPSIVFTRTEYGNINSYYDSVRFLHTCAESEGIMFHTTATSSNELLWNALCVKNQFDISRKFGFYTPCIMCHLFAHLLRIPILMNNNAAGIITGERVFHNSTIKANQHNYVLSCFSSIFENVGIQIIRPVYSIVDDSEIDGIIKDRTVISEANSVKCVLSGNFNGNLFADPEMEQKLRLFVDDYVYPVGKSVAESIIEGADLSKIYQIIEKEQMRCLHG